MVVKIKSRINATTLLKDCIKNKNNEELLNFLTNYKNNLEEKLNNYQNLILTGNCGVGKTFIINAFINEINRIVLEREIQTYNYTTHSMVKSIERTNCKAIITNIYNIIKHLRNVEYNRSDDCSRDYKGYDVLAIDEIGVQFATDAERQILFDVFDYRYDNFKPTFLISNFPVDNSANKSSSLKTILGLRIYDRVVNSQTKIINLCGKSLR